ncbi:MAG: AsmA family protein [Balneolaceae bacterium]
MFLRWIYNSWKLFWRAVGVLFLVMITVAAIGLAVIQLPVTKNIIKSELIQRFNSDFEGQLYIESLHGFLPFNAELRQVELYESPESDRPFITVGRAYVSVNLWQLLQRNIEVTRFELLTPRVELNTTADNRLNLVAALQQKTEREPSPPGEFGMLFNRFYLFAPLLTVVDGTLEVDESVPLPDLVRRTNATRLDELNIEVFIESSEEQVFFDLNQFTATTTGGDWERISMSGQFFHDREFLELNSFQIQANDNLLTFSASATPVDLTAPNVEEQIASAQLQISIDEGVLHARDADLLLPSWVLLPHDLFFQGGLSGTLDDLRADGLELYLGESAILADASARSFFTPERTYEARLTNVVLHQQELQWLLQQLGQTTSATRYGNVLLHGDLEGNQTGFAADLDMQTDAGRAEFTAGYDFRNGQTYSLAGTIDSLDITPFLGDTLQQTVLLGTLSANGSGFDRAAMVDASFSFDGSRYGDFELRNAHGDLRYNNGVLDYELRLAERDTEIDTEGRVRFFGDSQQLQTETRFLQFNPNRYYPLLPYGYSRFTGSLSANLEGTSVNDLYGRLSIEMAGAIIENDSLRPHQLFFDLTPADSDQRRLRFTSSFLDVETVGTIAPDNIRDMAAYWASYLKARADEELLFVSEELIDQLIPAGTAPELGEMSVDLSADIRLKDLPLLRHYLPGLPELTSSATITASVQANKETLSFNYNLFDSNASLNGTAAQEFSSSLQARLRADRPLREHASIDFQLAGALFERGNWRFNNAYINATLRDSLLQVEQQIEQFGDDVQSHTRLQATLKENRIDVRLDSLSLGNPTFTWTTTEPAHIRYDQNRHTTVESLTLSSGDDLVSLSGTFSNSPEDSVSYEIRNFELSKVSDLIGGRVQFSGMVNGDFTTRALGIIPSVQGVLQVDQGRLNGRTIGDLRLDSRFNSEQNRFNTQLRVYTDPERYAGYREQNNGIGHDLRFDGYFRLPDEADDSDDLFYFDADLREIDMWIVSVITPNTIPRMEGRSSGSGFIRGSATDFDFEATFMAENVEGTPLFINVDYLVSGQLDFTKSDGLLFRDIELRDSRGGRGTLSGQVDLMEFTPENRFDLSLQLNNLMFMNNVPDPDVPFYAELYGTGLARLTGTNDAPVLQSVGTVNLSSNSRVWFPLREETELQQDRRFIRFVDSFNASNIATRRPVARGENGANGNQNNQNRTFLDLFTLDVQLSANNPINVQLIFDPVTNEILNTSGTGQIRILAQDQDLNIFGRFNIQGGDYQFVAGDIITRRFTLREGGSINWQGDLESANLDVTAAFRTRPDISVISPTVNTFQRVPIELILEIGGTIGAIENEFFFTVPATVEGTTDPTIANQINTLNQNEDEKTVQALAILLTGNFIPSDQTANLGFGDNVTGTTALVNPLLSSQIISPLLSNQINALLNDDVVFDVDVSLRRDRVGGQETDQFGVDLDVALRLFNDRIILRREGQIAGQQTNIGDLGATYRINRILSVTAFHRQDPTLANRTDSDTRQTQEMNGLGVEAQYQFNTWGHLWNQIKRPFRWIFGSSGKEEEVPSEETESIAEN